MLKGLHKNLWLFSLTAFLLLYLPLLGREYIVLREEALYDAQWHARELAHQLLGEMRDQADVLHAVETLDKPAVLSAFHVAVVAKMEHFHVKELKIYARDGKIVYSNRSTRIGTLSPLNEDLHEAFKGESVVEFIDPDEIKSEYGEDAQGSMVEVYEPVLDEKGVARFVFETYYEYTPYAQRSYRRFVGSAASLAVILGLCVGLMTFAESRRRALEKKVRDLSLLPICSYCKKIRVSGAQEAEARWERIETYFNLRGNYQFTHGICGTCIDEHFPQYAAQVRKEAEEEAAAKADDSGAPPPGSDGKNPAPRS